MKKKTREKARIWIVRCLIVAFVLSIITPLLMSVL